LKEAHCNENAKRVCRGSVPARYHCTELRFHPVMVPHCPIQMLCRDDCLAIFEQFQNSNKEPPGKGEEGNADKTKHNRRGTVCSLHWGEKAEAFVDEVTCTDGTDQKKEAGCEPTCKHRYVDDDNANQT
jgi:hypothetical protein